MTTFIRSSRIASDAECKEDRAIVEGYQLSDTAAGILAPAPTVLGWTSVGARLPSRDPGKRDRRHLLHNSQRELL